jgi:hypothetical protein
MNMNKKTLLFRVYAVLFAALLMGLVMPMQAAVVTHNVSTSSLTIPSGSTDQYVITGTTTTNTVVIQSGFKGQITLQNLDMRLTGAAPITIQGLYNCDPKVPVTVVDVVLDGTNYIWHQGAFAAIQVDRGAQINISAINPQDNSSGVLTAMVPGSGGGAGIGARTWGMGGSNGEGTTTLSSSSGACTASHYNTAGGNVTISSGTVTAKGGHAAGIGGASFTWYNGIIIITGGIVNATSGFDAAGIGTGCPLGTGVVNCFADGSAIIVLPPAQISAQGAGAGPSGGVGSGLYSELGLAGTDMITYIGDPAKPEIDIYTETLEPFAAIYADIREMDDVEALMIALKVSDKVDINAVRFGFADASGHYRVNGQLDQPITFFTDASSTQTATWGRPFVPKQMTTTGTTNADKNPVELELLDALIAFEVTPSVPMEVGYSTADALTNSYMLKITYSDPIPITGLTFALANGSGSDFKGLTFYGSDGTTVISDPTSFNFGDVYYIKVPIKDGYPLGIYTDVLRFEGMFKGAKTGVIRQVVEQRIVLDDTGTNAYIKVTANPASFITNNKPSAQTLLTLNITHGTTSVLYNQSDVTAKYLISDKPNYDDAIAAVPLTLWPVLNAPLTDGGNMNTLADNWDAMADGTYYIHWYVASGVVYAHSTNFVSPAGTYGAFGEYILDTVGPTVSITINSNNGSDPVTNPLIISDGTPLNVEITFNEPIDLSSFVAGDFTISGSFGSISAIALKSGNVYSAVLTPAPAALVNGATYTVSVAANSVNDVAANSNPTASNEVTIKVDQSTKPVVDMTDIKTVYTSLTPTFKVEINPADFAINTNTDLYRSSATVINAGEDLAAMFTITPNAGSPLATSAYTAVYSKTGSDATARGVVTFNFSADLANTTTYTVALAANNVYNMLKNGNDAATATFTTALPTFVGGLLKAEPNLFPDAGGTTTLSIVGTALEINAAQNGLTLRIKSADMSWDSGLLSSGFVKTLDGTKDSLAVTGVVIPPNLTGGVVTYDFELYWSPKTGDPETTTGLKATVTVEPAMSKIVNVENQTPSVAELTYGYTSSQADAQKQTIKVTNMGAVDLQNFSVTLSGANANAFIVDASTLPTTLGAGLSFTFTVAIDATPPGKDVGAYNANVIVSAEQVSAPGTKLNGSDDLLEQKVVPADGWGKGGSSGVGVVEGMPEPSTTWVNIPSILLTAKALPATGATDAVKDWKYLVSTSATPPATPNASDWTGAVVVSSSSPATYTVPAGIDGTYYIHYLVNTNNYYNINGIVTSSTAVDEYNIDNIAPEVVSIVSSRSTTNNTPFIVTFTFDEPSELANADVTKFTATNATVGNLVRVSSTEYTVEVTPNTGLANGTPITISAAAGAIKDKALNNNLPSAATRNASVIYDSSRPNPTLTTPKSKVNTKFTVTVTFDKPISGFDPLDPSKHFTILNGNMDVSSFKEVSSGTVFEFDVNPGLTGDIDITLSENQVSDAGGNKNTMGFLKVQYSNTPIGATLSYTGPTYENGPFKVQVAFTQDVTGLLASHFDFASDLTASLTQLTPKTYTLTLTPAAGYDKSTPVTLKSPTTALDEFGNAVNGGSNTVNINYDTKPPVVEFIAMENAKAEVNFDPFNVVIRFNEPNIPSSLDITKLESDILDILSVVSGPTTVGAGTEYVVRVQVPFDTAVTGALLGMKVNAGAVKDKATNPNTPSGVINLTNWTTSGGGGGTRGPSGPPVIFVDNVDLVVVSMSPSGDWAPVVGNIVITFNKKVDQSAPGTIWLEDFGYLDLSKATWVTPQSISLPYGYLTYNSTYRVHVAGFRDLSKKIQTPEYWGVFSTGAPVRPTMQREIILFAGQGIEISVDPSKIHYVMIGSDFVFNVKAKSGYNLDNLQVISGIEHRDQDKGIVIEKNADGTAKVTVKYVIEPILYITVTIGASANESLEATNVWAYGDNLYIRALQPTTANVYAMSGVLFRQIPVSEGLTTAQLPRGIYTVLMEGKTYKVVIK